jgi:anti-anti-sigma factor
MAELEIKKHDGGATIRPMINIVSSSIPAMRTEIKTLIDEGIKDIVIDLVTVEIVDSMGIGLLISAHNSLTKMGGKMAVINASKDVLSLLKAMRLDQRFSISGS